MSKMPKIKVAITGSIGSGKSTVSEYLRSKNYPVFDADKEVANIYASNQHVKDTLKLWFGEDILVDNQVNRPYLRMIFNESLQEKEKVEKLVHPLVQQAMVEYFKDQGPIVFAEIPLLYEAQMQSMFEQVWFVYTDKKIIVDRLLEKRGLSKEQIDYMMSWQMDPDKKSALANTILYNNNDINELYAQVDQALTSL